MQINTIHFTETELSLIYVSSLVGYIHIIKSEYTVAGKIRMLHLNYGIQSQRRLHVLDYVGLHASYILSAVNNSSYFVLEHR